MRKNVFNVFDLLNIPLDVIDEDSSLSVGNVGQVPFVNTSEDNLDYSSNLFWDNTNVRLGIGTNIPDAKHHILGTDDEIQQIVQGNSVQNNNLSEWRLFDDTVVASINQLGSLNLGTPSNSTTITVWSGGDRMIFDGDGTNVKFRSFDTASLVLGIPGNAEMFKLERTTNRAILGQSVFSGVPSAFFHILGKANEKQFLIQGFAGQTNFLTEWEDSVGANQAYISANGTFGQGGFDVFKTTDAQTGGTFNVFVGPLTGGSNSGSGNMFLGRQAGQVNTTGSDNVFIGRVSGRSNTTGTGNVFIGRESGLSSVSATNLVYLGAFSGRINTASNNTFIGGRAGGNAIGGNNVFVGTRVGFSSSGGNNTLIGAFAGQNATTLSQNVMIGFSSGQNSTIAQSNVFIGHDSGQNVTTGNNNVYIGDSSGRDSATGTGNVFIGFQTGAAETGDNKLYIANTGTVNPLIYGEFDNDLFRINGRQEIIGQSDQIQFYVQGFSGQTADYLNFQDDTAFEFLRVTSDEQFLLGRTSGTQSVWGNPGQFEALSDLSNGVAFRAGRTSSKRGMEVTTRGQVSITGNGIGAEGQVFFLNNGITRNSSNQNNTMMRVNAQTIAPTSGSTRHNWMRLEGTINATGTFAATNYGIWFDPTITSLNGQPLFAFRAEQGNMAINNGKLIIGDGNGFQNLPEPSAKFEVIGQDDEAQFIVRANATQTNPWFELYDETNTRFFFVNNGNNHFVFDGDGTIRTEGSTSDLFVRAQRTLYLGTITNDNIVIGRNDVDHTTLIDGSIAVRRVGTAIDVNTSNETIIGVTDTTVSRTITLDSNDVESGRIIIIKDESGGAGTNNITIDTQGSETIDGAATQTISTNYGVIKVYCDGSNWFTF